MKRYTQLNPGASFSPANRIPGMRVKPAEIDLFSTSPVLWLDAYRPYFTARSSGVVGKSWRDRVSGTEFATDGGALTLSDRDGPLGTPYATAGALNQRIDLGDAVAWPSSDWSFAFVANTLTKGNHVIRSSVTAATEAILYYVNGPNYVVRVDQQGEIYVSSGSMNENQWYYHLVTYNDDLKRMNFYFDGVSNAVVDSIAGGASDDKIRLFSNWSEDIQFANPTAEILLWDTNLTVDTAARAKVDAYMLAKYNLTI